MSLKILIADDNVSFVEVLKQYFSQTRGTDTIIAAYDGFQAVKAIKANEPDVIIMDLFMPGLDGLGVLRKVGGMKLSVKPLIIIISAAGQNKIIRMSLNLGAEFFMIKPVDIEELMFRIDQLREIRNQDDICLAPIQSTSSAAVIPGKEAVSSQEKIVESMIISILNKLGVPTNLQGYRYLLSAIVMLSNDLTLINSVTKNLYTDLAAVWGTTPQRIERSIRNAIETTWVRGNIDYISKIFYSDNLSPKIRPSNSEFMIRIVNECWNQSLKTG